MTVNLQKVLHAPAGADPAAGKGGKLLTEGGVPGGRAPRGVARSSNP